MSITTDGHLRALYHELERDVSRAINIPLRPAALPNHIPDMKRRVLRFMETATHYDHLLPREEREILRQSLHDMVKDLDHTFTCVHDPPNDIDVSTLYTERVAGAAGARGRPAKQLHPQLLRMSLLHRSKTSIGASLGVSARTVRRRELALGLSHRCHAAFSHFPNATPVRNAYSRSIGFSPLSDVELDRVVASILVVFPTYGRRLVTGALRDRGLKIQKRRVTASIRRVTGRTRQFRRPLPVRRVYRVAGPNSLWHHDGQHGLIRWKIVIHAFIDGYSRYVLGIRASNNNRARTVLNLFEWIRQHTGATPHRCRGDCGMENVEVAEAMAQLRGVASYLWGRSVDNIRIERLWVDVVRNLVDKWYSFFRDLETYDGLNTGNPSHIWLLHHLYLDVINSELDSWADHWNSHPMDIAQADRQISARTRESPVTMYHYGHIRNGVRGFDLPTTDPEPVGEDELGEYGLDHQALEDEDILRSNLRNNADVDEPAHAGPRRPARFSRVDVLPPNCPLDAVQLEGLYNHVSERVDLDSPHLVVRRHWWICAVEYCRQIFPDVF